MKKRFLSMLVLLMTVVTGAWAQENEGWLSGITNGISFYRNSTCRYQC